MSSLRNQNAVLENAGLKMENAVVENTGPENAGMKMQDWKMRNLENAGPGNGIQVMSFTFTHV